MAVEEAVLGTGPAAAARADPVPAPEAGRFLLFARWGGLAGLAFFAVYPTMNWLTAQRTRRLHLYFPLELHIPLVPQAIWAYLSMYLIFFAPLWLLPAARMPALGKQLIAGTLLGGLLFLLAPADLGFTRVVPSAPPVCPLLFGDVRRRPAS